MSVLPGEGSFVILYGSTTFAVRTRSHRGYLARPDLAGAYPVAVVLGSVTSGAKELCRRLARRGFASVALNAGETPGGVSDLLRWVAAPGTPWADASRVGAIVTASASVDARSLAGADAIVLLDSLPTLDVGGPPILGLFGADGADVAEARRLAGDVPGSQWVFYADAPDGFWDLGAAGYRQDAAADAVDRIIGFFSAALGEEEAA